MWNGVTAKLDTANQWTALHVCVRAYTCTSIYAGSDPEIHHPISSPCAVHSAVIPCSHSIFPIILLRINRDRTPFVIRRSSITLCINTNPLPSFLRLSLRTMSLALIFANTLPIPTQQNHAKTATTGRNIGNPSYTCMGSLNSILDAQCPPACPYQPFLTSKIVFSICYSAVDVSVGSTVRQPLGQRASSAEK
jgi:hypothetical protein